MAEQKNIEVDFWGRVVDENEAGISGVRIVMHVRHWSFASAIGPASTFPKIEVFSDIVGCFEWHGETGDSLSLETVEKAGYKLSPKGPKTFSYGQSPEPFTPDPLRPVTIRMWRLRPTNSIIVHRGFFGFVPDGRLYTLDLVKNNKMEGSSISGDVTVKLLRSKETKLSERYPWHLEIAAVDGGIVEAKDDFLFEAPETGYLTRLVYDMDPAISNWTSVLRKQFYFRSRNNSVYGAIDLSARPQYNQESAVQIESALNTNGSRNLQR